MFLFPSVSFLMALMKTSFIFPRVGVYADRRDGDAFWLTYWATVVHTIIVFAFFPTIPTGFPPRRVSQIVKLSVG